jgi:acetyltransferase-like isoleucine patch superfamily enzyme
MRTYYHEGGLFYCIIFSMWRGSLAFQGLLLTWLYRRTLHRCGSGTIFKNGVYIGSPRRVEIGNHCYFGSGASISSELPSGELRISDHVQISDEVGIDYTGTVLIGKNTLISPRVKILSHDHGDDPRAEPKRYELRIDDDVWIGSDAIILPKASCVGKSAIIGTGSIVTRPVPERAVVAGNPARIIRFRDPGFASI